MEHEQFRLLCPRCESRNLTVRSLGFVNCEWKIDAQNRGGFPVSLASKTYDSQFHKLKESDLLKLWEHLQVHVRRLPPTTPKNSSSFVAHRPLPADEAIQD